ncbi:hypothetical protein [Thermus sp.]|uniref:hypothetical protein n=1 Tax=Thermus sp. TaxID=275 RepID=UPI00307E3368
MMGWWGMGLGGFGALLVLGLLFYFVYLTLPKKGETDGALETLRLRYAKGELDEETFKRLKRELGGGE